jgi:hypothetical protein
MLKDLERLLAEIARAQGLDVPGPRPAAPPRPPRPVVPAELVDAEVIEAEPVRETLEQHVARTVDTSDVTAQASHLGATVGRADDDLEARLHQTFDHSVSTLDPYDEARVAENQAAVDAASAVGEIAELLRTPKSVRHAVVLSEILKRPVHRW